MVFSKESSRAVFEMGNVELTELTKSSIRCPSYAYTTFLKEHFLQMRQADEARSRRDEPDLRSIRFPKGTILPHISDCHKR